jgi:hypothetical protein
LVRSNGRSYGSGYQAGINQSAQFGPIHQRVAQQGDGADFQCVPILAGHAHLVEQWPGQRPVPLEPERPLADEVDGYEDRGLEAEFGKQRQCLFAEIAVAVVECDQQRSRLWRGCAGLCRIFGNRQAAPFVGPQSCEV